MQTITIHNLRPLQLWILSIHLLAIVAVLLLPWPVDSQLVLLSIMFSSALINIKQKRAMTIQLNDQEIHTCKDQYNRLHRVAQIRYAVANRYLITLQLRTTAQKKLSFTVLPGMLDKSAQKMLTRWLRVNHD